jgi:hypothetical protein
MVSAETLPGATGNLLPDCADAAELNMAMTPTTHANLRTAFVILVLPA